MGAASVLVPHIFQVSQHWLHVRYRLADSDAVSTWPEGVCYCCASCRCLDNADELPEWTKGRRRQQGPRSARRPPALHQHSLTRSNSSHPAHAVHVGCPVEATDVSCRVDSLQQWRDSCPAHRHVQETMSSRRFPRLFPKAMS